MSDLIGSSPAKSARSALAARARSPETSGAGAVQQGEETTPTPTPPRVQKRAVNLVVDTLASINIKPRVSERRNCSVHLVPLYLLVILKIFSVHALDFSAFFIPLQSVEVYAKQTQTDVQTDRRGSESEEEVEAEPIRPAKQVWGKATLVIVLVLHSSSSSLLPSSSSSFKHESESEGVRVEGEAEGTSHRPPMVEMSSEQVERIVESDSFSLFMDRAGRLMERALCEPSDIFFDILGENEMGG